MNKNTKILIAVLVVFVGVVFWLQSPDSLNPLAGKPGSQQNEHAADGHGNTEQGGGDHAKGDSHGHSGGGHFFSQGDLKVRVTLFEGGGRPEFRIFPMDKTGRAIPSSEIKLHVELERLGGYTETFSFIESNGMFRSREEVGEPHSFEVRIRAEWKGGTYNWKFSQVEARAEINEDMARLSGIETAKAKPGSLKTLVSLNGEVGLDEKRTAHVVPGLEAVVRKVYAHLGDPVTKGETLALLDSRQLAEAKSLHLKALKITEPLLLDLEREKLIYKNTTRMLELLHEDTDLDSLTDQLDQMVLGESRARLVPAFAKMKQTRSVYEREKKLFARKISPESDFLLAEEQYQSARANYHALREKIAYDGKLALLEKQRAYEKADLDVQISKQKLLTLGLLVDEVDKLKESDEQFFTHYLLRAPLTGEIIQKHLAVGEVIGPNVDIIVVADLSELWVNIAIPAKELNAVKLGQKVLIQGDNPELKASGVLSYIGSVIDEKTRTVTGRVVIGNPKRIWRPGMYVGVDLLTDQTAVGISVPVEAVQELRGWNVVFVKYGDLYEARVVELGKTDGKTYEILKGLRPGETYVSKNSFSVKAEIGKSAATHSH